MQENVFTGEPAAEGVEPLTSDAAQRYILSMNRQLAVARQKLAEHYTARNVALESLRHIAVITNSASSEQLLLLNALKRQSAKKLAPLSAEKISQSSLKVKALEAACKAIEMVG